MTTDSDSPPATAFRQRWDVFLSFRREDKREDFSDRLFKALDSEGIRVFHDDDGLNQGDEISHGLLEAIEDSAAAIAVISENYASSSRCLEELAHLFDSQRLLLPVFYRVDPSHVRRQEGPFKKDIEDLERRYGEKKVERWRKAMARAGGIKGLEYNHSKEQHLIQDIVRRILTELSNSPMILAPYVVGLDRPLEKLMKWSNLKHNGVKILCLHGIGGVGKTTLAKALYNKLSGHFEARSFISNVREQFLQHGGHVRLRNELISDLSPEKRPLLHHDVDAGLLEIKKIVRRKRVLLVIDDIDHEEQLNALAGSRDWYFHGSRIIITTRNIAALPNGFVDQMYEVKQLDFPDSLKLFNYHAFRKEKAPETFLSFSEKIAKETDGIPLALEVFGSFLYDKRRVEEWEDALEKLTRIRPPKLQDVLKISFDALDLEVQCAFLDIACFFPNFHTRREDLIDVLRGCGFAAKDALTNLVSRSLIKLTQGDALWMHDQIRDMGRQIVEQENLSDVQMRSRIWKHEDVLRVLHGGRGTKNTRGIILNCDKMSEEIKSSKSIALSELCASRNLTSVVRYIRKICKGDSQYDAEKGGEIVETASLGAMVNLRLLQLSNVKLEGDLRRLPPSLRWLQWKNCSLRKLPSDFCPRELAVLDLSESQLERLWGMKQSWNRQKVADQLMILKLQNCHHITTMPDLSGLPNLEKLNMERCTKLQSIHQSIGYLTSLRYLNLSHCSGLVEFPEDVSGLGSLEILDLSGCENLSKLPTDIGCMRSLRMLLLDNTIIKQLPESIFQLTKLQKLSLNRSSKLKHLPKGIGKLTSLKELSLCGSALEEMPESLGSLENLEILSLIRCQSLFTIPESIGNLMSLQEVSLDGSSLKALPESIGFLYNLRKLSFGGCPNLTRLPDSIKGLSSVIWVTLDRTGIICPPDEIGSLKSVRRLDMRECKYLVSLPDSIGNMLALEELFITNAAIIELPESIGSLGNLIVLNLNRCEKLQKLPSSIGNLKTLSSLLIEETAVTGLPETLGLLSNLKILKMAKKPNQNYQHDETIDSIPNSEREAVPVMLPASFSNLSCLEEFDARAWKISGKIADDFQKLSRLETLNLSHNDFLSLPASLSGLFSLRKLILSYCRKLKSLPPLPSSLVDLNTANCTALENAHDFSNLECLQELNLANCEKLMDIPGIEGLKSLRRLHMVGCRPSAAEAVMRKLGKAALKKLYTLSIPGSQIPEWFNQDSVHFFKRKNFAIKAVIIAVIISVNHKVQDNLRDQLPATRGIVAKILRQKQPVYTTEMYLTGVPKTDENQLYLCRYSHLRPMVFLLHDGDEIQVVVRSPPLVKGVNLKKYGIHLVFEDDDDYDGDEDSLDEDQQSVSERLRRFIVS